MGKPDASRTLRFELNRLDLADMTVKPHTIKIVGPAPAPDIAGLCERLRRPGLKSAAEAADTIERQAAEIERLRGPLPDLLQEHVFSLRVEAMAMGEAGAHYALIADLIEARATLTGEDPGTARATA